MAAHDIEVHRLDESTAIHGVQFEAETARVVPLSQPQYQLIRSLFETETEFADSTFYDVSTWTLPLAFDAEWAALPKPEGRNQKAALGSPLAGPATTGRYDGASNETYAWIFEWTGTWAPRTLYRLERAGVSARVATAAFTVSTERGNRSFAPGTVVIHSGLEGNQRASIDEILTEATLEDGTDVYTVTGGLAVEGVDLGSPSLRAIRRPVVALATGKRVSQTRAGELWHLLDRLYGIEVSLIDEDRLGELDLGRYTHLALPDGSYDLEAVDAVKDWVAKGGVVVASGGGTRFAAHILGREEDALPEEETSNDTGDTPRRSYGDFRSERGIELLAGAFFGVELDRSHPIAYGYADDQLPVFRVSTLRLAPSPNPYENLAFYQENPLLSGYASANNQERLSGSVAAMATRSRKGLVVQLLDPPNFRSWVRGPNRLFLNALFFSDAVDQTTPPASWGGSDGAGEAAQAGSHAFH